MSIANHSASNGAVIVDHLYNESLRDTSRSGARMMRRAGRAAGEGYLCAIDAGEVGPFLARRGRRAGFAPPPRRVKSNDNLTMGRWFGQMINEPELVYLLSWDVRGTSRTGRPGALGSSV
jgi:hypothetical protein